MSEPVLILPEWTKDAAPPSRAGPRPLGGGMLTPSSTGKKEKTTARERTETVAAHGALVPVSFGGVRMPGMVFAVAKIGADLVVGYIWCVGPVHAIDTLWLNDAAVPGAVTVTHYTGTPSQGVDATLAAAIPAYADSLRIQTPGGLRGLAYSVVRIPPAALTGWPRAQAEIRARTVLDDRSASTVYSENTALALADVIRDADYGHGVPAYGVAACADWNDTLIGEAGDVPRCRVSYMILAGASTEGFIDELAQHAECFVDYEADGLRMTPNAPVNLALVPVVGPDWIIEGSLSVSADEAVSAPTEVEVQHLVKTGTAENWSMQPAEPARLPGVDEGTLARVPESVGFEGVFRSTEAASKALALLRRKQHPVTVRWRTRDIGVIYQRGDVVRLQLPARGVDDLPVRIVQVDLEAPGRYAITATRYDASHYPDDLVLPGAEGLVPIGAIVMLNGEAVPDGWADYTDANGRYIVGAGGAYAVGATGGGGAITVSGTTSTSGAHAGGSGAFDVPVQSGSGTYFGVSSTSSSSEGAHAHSVPSTEVTPSPARRDDRLIIKSGTLAARFPAAAKTWGLGGLAHPDIERILSDADRVLRAHTVAGGFAAAGAVAIATGSASDAHDHVNGGANSSSPGGLLDNYKGASGGGMHSHSGTIVPASSPARRRLALYGGLREYPVMPGCIVMWSGAVGALPENWVLCDGTLDTPDMRDLFVAVAGTGQESTAAGDNTVSITASLASVSHSHGAGTQKTPLAVSAMGRHTASASHTHTFSSTQSWMPAYYALAFIMYRPGV